MKERWIANTAKKMPVDPDVLVDIVHACGEVTKRLPAKTWDASDKYSYDPNSWWEGAADSKLTIIAWKLSKL